MREREREAIGRDEREIENRGRSERGEAALRHTIPPDNK